MNGYKYRCIVSGGTCLPGFVTTNELATLTVNAGPAVVVVTMMEALASLHQRNQCCSNGGAGTIYFQGQTAEELQL